MYIKRGLLFLLIIVSLVPIIVSAQESQADNCKNVKYKELCYTLAAQSEKDKDICENILNDEIRKKCMGSASRTNPIYYIIPIIVLGLFAYLIKKRTILIKKKEQEKIEAFIKNSRLKGYSLERIRKHLLNNKVPVHLINKELSKNDNKKETK